MFSVVDKQTLWTVMAHEHAVTLEPLPPSFARTVKVQRRPAAFEHRLGHLNFPALVFKVVYK